MSVTQDGQLGERFIMNFLHSRGNEAYQLDCIWQDHKTGILYFGEVKTKSLKYNINGFIGHGADKPQLDSRMKIQNEWLHIRVVMFFVDKDEECIYWNYLDNLYSLDDTPIRKTCDYIITSSNIIVFPLDSLHKISLTHEQYIYFCREWNNTRR